MAMVYNNRPVSGMPAVKAQGEVQRKHSVRQTGDFADILRGKLGAGQDLKISKHAQLRMETRNLNLTDSQRTKLSEAVDRAEAKGVKETLVVMDRMAFVINVRNRMVITALNSGEMKENVFTNIDGAVFAD